MTFPTSASPAPPAGDAASAAILKISHVAQMVGVSTSTVRLWESEGLIAPARTPSGQRQYSMHNVSRLKLIKKLMSEGEMTLAGVRSALDGGTGIDAAENISDPLEPNVGDRVRKARKAAGLSLRDLAEGVAMSPSALSAFERGVSHPNLGRISQIAHALETTVEELLAMPEADEELVVRRGERPVLPLELEGVLIENLYTSSTLLQSQMVTVQPGCGSGDPMAHNGDEFVTVIEGTIDVDLDVIETYRLHEGDSMSFPSIRPHSYHNRGDRVARAVWVNTPPTF